MQTHERQIDRQRFGRKFGFNCRPPSDLFANLEYTKWMGYDEKMEIGNGKYIKSSIMAKRISNVNDHYERWLCTGIGSISPTRITAQLNFQSKTKRIENK